MCGRKLTWFFHFQRYQMDFNRLSGIMQYMAFCNQLLALSIMFLRFIQVVAWSHSFWLSNIPLCGHTTFCLSMSPGFGRGACFHLLPFADSGCYDPS